MITTLDEAVAAVHRADDAVHQAQQAYMDARPGPGRDWARHRLDTMLTLLQQAEQRALDAIHRHPAVKL